MCTAEIFACRMCGDCCRGYGGTFVSAGDIRRIAAYLGVDAERFVETYCQFSGRRPVLAQADNGYCVFWDGKCTIHPVKPRMCRQWPYLQSVLVDVGNWHAMADSCPGMRTDVGDDVIRACVARMLEKD
jgi:Fe-S-cluster containining protein